MGGIGSGTYVRWNAYTTTSQVHAVDIRTLARSGDLEPGQWRRQFHYDGRTPVAVIRTSAESPDQICLEFYPLGRQALSPCCFATARITWTDCGRGGRRPWFRCPRRECGRRAAILYAFGEFGCRRCLHLVYRSQRMSAEERAIVRLEKTRARLGWGATIFDPLGSKPRKMRQTTFQVLEQQERALRRTVVRDMLNRM